MNPVVFDVSGAAVPHAFGIALGVLPVIVIGATVVGGAIASF